MNRLLPRHCPHGPKELGIDDGDKNKRKTSQKLSAVLFVSKAEPPTAANEFKPYTTNMSSSL